MRKLLLLTGLLIGIAVMAGYRKAGAASPQEPVAVEKNGRLELVAVSFNIRNDQNQRDTELRTWTRRIGKAVRLIRKMDPDVMGMQELTDGQAADLRASLPDYRFFGNARENGERKGEYAGIFFRQERFERDPSDGGTFWLSATPEKAGSATWGNTFPRVATWTRLRDKLTDRHFYVYNTHFDHRHQGSREQAAVLLAQRIDARKYPDEPVILLGDFNAVESNPAVAYLAGKAGRIAGTRRQWKNPLIDTFQFHHPKEQNRRTLHLWQGSREGGLKVDHILVSKDAKVLEAGIVPDSLPFTSDHFPVTAKVAFP